MREQLPLEYEWEGSSKLVRSPDAKAAEFVIAASQVQQTDEGPVDVLKTERDQLDELEQEIQEKYWFMRPEYKTRQPKEQWTLTVGFDTVTVFNYSEKAELTNEQVATIAHTIGRFAATFPNLHPEISAITIADAPYDDPLEDDMGEASPRASMFMLNSYALENGIYRPELPVPRLEAVILHELAHFELDAHLEPYWEDAGFSWEKVVFSEKLDQKAHQPEACVTEYGVRGGVYEDIAESAVAYMLSGSKLNETKREILGRFDNWRRIPDIKYVKEEKIVLPKLPKELPFYVDDEATDDPADDE